MEKGDVMRTMRVAILTISDRSARGERPDRSAPALADVITRQGWDVVRTEVIPDEWLTIHDTLVRWTDSQEIDVLLTTGGTGFSPRDVTPEATKAVLEKEAPGLAEAMRASGLRITPHAMLSRAVCGIRKATLIVNLPGSPRAAVENLEVILPVLPHAVELLRSAPDAEAGHRYQGSEYAH